WSENHPCRDIDVEELKTWEVRELCDPIGSYPPVLFSLDDGTSIYGSRHRKDDICFRGRMKEDCHVKCLPADALIDTPEGPVSVETLRVGDPVWSVDTLGNRVQTSVEAAGATPVRGH